MPDWGWCVAIFVALTIGYLSGFFAGSWKADAAPTSAAWRAVREYGIDAKKQTAMESIRAEHEEQMAMIERGVFDHMPGDEDTEDDDDE